LEHPVGRSCSSGQVETPRSADGSSLVRRGFLRSPNWPGDYPAGADCQWTISAERGRQILVVVSRVELAAGVDGGAISRTDDERHCNDTEAQGDWLSIADTSGESAYISTEVVFETMVSKLIEYIKKPSCR